MSEDQRICPICGEEKNDEETIVLKRSRMWVHEACVKTDDSSEDHLDIPDLSGGKFEFT